MDSTCKKQDLQEIYDYISRDSVFYANRFIDDIFSRAENLQNFPESGRVVPEFASDNLRELIIGNYRLVYGIISEVELHIVRVHHSARILK